MFRITLLFVILFTGCQYNPNKDIPTSNSGVTIATAVVKPQSNGLTTEQSNVRNRIQMENIPGSIKHLYIISAYSGQVLIYSTVKGKVTSSGKRLTPKTVLAANANGGASAKGCRVNIGGKNYRTSEVLGDDGTYGSSIPYIYWFDTKGIYHQHYVSGGQIIHISNKPIPIKSVVLNMELQTLGKTK